MGQNRDAEEGKKANKTTPFVSIPAEMRTQHRSAEGPWVITIRTGSSKKRASCVKQIVKEGEEGSGRAGILKGLAITEPKKRSRKKLAAIQVNQGQKTKMGIKKGRGDGELRNEVCREGQADDGGGGSRDKGIVRGHKILKQERPFWWV